MRKKNGKVRTFVYLFIALTVLLVMGVHYKPAIKSKIIRTSLGKKLLKDYVKFKKRRSVAAKKERAVVDITVDANQVIGKFYRFYDGIGLGSFNEGVLAPHNREFFNLLGEINKKNPNTITFVNAKGMFADKYKKMRVDIGGHVYKKDKSGRVYYDWRIVDEVFDTFMRNGLKPIVSLTFMPDSLASNLNNRNDWNKANVSPPKDYNEWKNLVYHLVKHLDDRYGAQEIQKWYFEVWNEPDLPHFFWVRHPDKERYPRRGDNREYFKLYDYAVAGALQANPNIKIGGPAIAGDIKLFIKEWLRHCTKEINYATGERGTRVDFISRHCYGRIEDKILPSYKQFVDVAKKAAGDKFDELEIIVSETGPSTKPRGWLNTRYAAAWIVKEMDGLFNLVDTEGMDYLPRVFCFWTKPVPPNFGTHFGLATALGNPWHPYPEALLKRPAFNAIIALSMLGEERLELKGASFGDYIHGIATRDKEKGVQLVLYHLNEKDYNNSKKRTYRINLKIENLDWQKIQVKEYAIDSSHSNSYQKWLELGSPQYPSKDQLNYLKANQDLQLISEQEFLVEDKMFNKTIYVENNSVFLLTINKM